MNLLELLVSLLLASLIGFAAVAGLHLNLRTQHDLFAAEKRENDFDKLAQTIGTALQRSAWLSAYRGFEIRPRAKMPGGERLPQLPPSASDDAITFAELSTDFIMRGAESDANIFCLQRLRAVPRNSAFAFSEANFYLAFSIEGIQLIRAKLPRAFSGKCVDSLSYRMQDKAIQQIFSGTAPRVTRVLALLPLDDAATLYLDRRGMLRRYSHLSRQSLAIAGPFSAMRFSIDDAKQLFLLEAEKHQGISRTRKRSFFPLPENRTNPLDLIS